MERDETSTILLILVAGVALVGLVLAGLSFASQRSMWGMMGGGGMMGDGTTSTDTGPGGIEWIVLVASVIFFLAAVVFVARGRTRGGISMASLSVGPLPPQATPVAPVPSASGEASGPVPEMTLVRLLDGDERRMYLEIRERGGEVLQRDLVAMGTYSKAKVTRVLDKLEGKGIVVRERHGMTNRVRLVVKTAK